MSDVVVGNDLSINLPHKKKSHQNKKFIEILLLLSNKFLVTPFLVDEDKK